ncbi:MAG: glycosyltransferase family 39 protein [Patescibacteria group bacterium]
MKFSLQKFKAFVLNPNFLILIILLIAAFVRLYRIEDYMTFLGDEGRDVLIVYNILHGKLTLLGPTASVGGFFLGPIYYYFMAPFLWLFNYNPVGPAVMVAFFGIATVGLLYKFSSEFFGKRVGLIAASLYAISPLVIAYSRSSWNPNLFPFFSLLTLYILYKGLKENKTMLFLICGFLLGISMQLHYLAFFLGTIIFAYLLGISLVQTFLGKVRNTLRDCVKQNLLIFSGFIIGLSPFLAFEARHNIPNTLSIFKFIFRSGDTGTSVTFFSNISDVFFRLFARFVANYPPPDQIAAHTYSNTEVWYFLALSLALTSLVILVHKLIKTFPSKNYQERFPGFLKFSLLTVWLVLGVGLFGFYKKNIYDYYFGFMFVLPFILTAYSLDFLGSKNKALKIVCIVSFLGLIAINLYGIPFKNPPNRQMNQMRTVAQFVLDKTEGRPFNFALITGGNSDHAYKYFFTLENHPPVTIENKVVDPDRKTVTDQLLVVCEQPCQPLGNSLWEVAGFGRAEIVREWDVIVVKVYKLVHYQEK